ncbi:ribosomal L7Ae/L30e/S12e/Gadd45 family protein [Clostridium polynesiense]|uniref:ribosomal L7Ae/L30e/S12e/Gadd45 family protein n=1 Tax=Clostridium polynesiense TaxID=1325933 RepID=UPI00058BF5EB|nr:ribosomal L7Ae/L30e/S12e/Gadd45 family protein [Clostridium polynesiense]
MNKFLQFLSIAKKSGSIIEGYNNCEAVLGKKHISLFLFSNEISSNSEKKFAKYCELNSIPYIKEFSKYELGSSLGRTEINIVCVTDKNIGNKLLTIFRNG